MCEVLFSTSYGEPKETIKAVRISWFYGKSGKGRSLQAIKILPSESTPNQKTVLLVFSLHGFEDAWWKDGKELTQIGNEVVNHFVYNPTKLYGNSLLVIPCANPDGQIEGWTNNGPGRCQISKGIDLNRDFGYSSPRNQSPRCRTGSRPFSAPESVALRNLVNSQKPYLVLDFHGWLGSTMGDKPVSRHFDRWLRIGHSSTRLPPNFFTGWTSSKRIKSALVEYPNPFSGKGSLGPSKKSLQKPPVPSPVEKWKYSEKTINAVADLLKDVSRQSI